MVGSIVTTLDELIRIQKQLVEIADRKRTILIERNIDDLNALIQEEEELLTRLNQLENEREQQVANAQGNDSSLTFSEYIEHVQDEFTRKKLQSQQAIIYDGMVELQEKNRVNDVLLKDALQFVRHMMDQITKSKQQQFNYQSPLGKQSMSTNTQGFFDTKA